MFSKGVLIDIYLVQTGVRNACLIQLGDQKASFNDVIHRLKKYKINLQTKEIYAGLLITKNLHNIKVSNDNEIGKILGYPSPGDQNKSRGKYLAEILVTLNNRTIQTHATIGIDIEKMKKWALPIMTAIKKMPTKYMGRTFDIEKVRLNIRRWYSKQELLEAMQSGLWDKDIKYAWYNTIWNYFPYLSTFKYNPKKDLQFTKYLLTTKDNQDEIKKRIDKYFDK